MNKTNYFHLTTPSRCSFELYFNGRNLWDSTNIYSNNESSIGNDPMVHVLKQQSEGYILSRLLFDTSLKRSKNKQFHTYNPYTTYSTKQNKFDKLFAPQPNFKYCDSKKCEIGIFELKTLLEEMEPYVQCCKYFHEEVMEGAHGKHEMFQKSVFYEVFFFYCQNSTSTHLLSKAVLGLNDRFFGWGWVSVPNMIEKYTGKQYIAIVPRGFGKTRCIRTIAAVFLISFPGVEILALAHRKALITSVKDDVRSLLTTAFPPTMYGQYTLISHEDTMLLSRPGSKQISKFKYGSSYNADSLRGNDPDIGFQDEFMCIPERSHTILNAMNQRKHTKIGFLSSPMMDKKENLINLVQKMNIRCVGINLYRLCSFCMNPSHVQYSTTHTGCYRSLFTPSYITYSSDNKEFESIMTNSEASYKNELGVIHPSELKTEEGVDLFGNTQQCSQFSSKFVKYLKQPETYCSLYSNTTRGVRDEVYWIYIDPAYHASKQSAMAICCVKYDSLGPMLVFMDRKLILNKDLGRVGELMENMYTRCVSTIVEHSAFNTSCHFFVAIERNINPDATITYYKTWVNQTNRYPPDKVSFMLYVDLAKQGPRRPLNVNPTMLYGYLVDKTKKNICDNIINLLNVHKMGRFRISITTEYGLYTSDTCMVEQLVEEMKKFQTIARLGCTGKISSQSTDDCVFCFLMAIHLGSVYKRDAMNRIHNVRLKIPCTLPWIKPNCRCLFK